MSSFTSVNGSVPGFMPLYVMCALKWPVESIANAPLISAPDAWAIQAHSGWKKLALLWNRTSALSALHCVLTHMVPQWAMCEVWHKRRAAQAETRPQAMSSLPTTGCLHMLEQGHDKGSSRRNLQNHSTQPGMRLGTGLLSEIQPCMSKPPEPAKVSSLLGTRHKRRPS